MFRLGYLSWLLGANKDLPWVCLSQAPSLLGVSHSLKGLHPEHRCSLISCCYRSWGLHLQSFSHINSRNRLRSVTLLTLQDNMNVVVGCGPQTWMIPTQHLTVPLALCSPETHKARFCRSSDTSLVGSSVPDHSGAPYATHSYVQLTGFVSMVFQRSPATIYLTLRMYPQHKGLTSS